jgi:hypothetical protein
MLNFGNNRIDVGERVDVGNLVVEAFQGNQLFFDLINEVDHGVGCNC